MKSKTLHFLKYTFPLLTIGFLLLLSTGCKKDDGGSDSNPINPNPTSGVPTVTTTAASNISQTTATSGGNVTSDGGATVTTRGICWSTSATPTIADSKTTDGSGTGSFTSSLTGLTANTHYYIRAYATNSNGTGYGSAVSCTTLVNGGGTVTDVDGNVYHTITIGIQVWMVENLKTTKYRNGDPITNITDNAQWNVAAATGAPGYCIYDNDAANASTYGHIYNWYAVNDSRNIAPAGWHIPTRAEMQTLMDFLGGDSQAGNALKESGSTHWQSSNTAATNSSGFTALPGGFRYENGNFLNKGEFAYFWSITTFSNDATEAYYRSIYTGNGSVNDFYTSKATGFSVRCIKD
ncbi:MAG: hypothetical protein HGB11_02765 [Chlorobiales bacterium]|nr:hypothetical protein [Chlorobiales bacterium]